MEVNLNKLLLRQIRRHFGSADNLPDEFTGIIQDINNTYQNFEDDTQLLQNSIEISSQELRDAFLKQKQNAEAQKETINKIKEAIYAINPSDRTNIVESEHTFPNSNYLFDSLIKLIEERKQAEESLRESEFRMMSLTSTAQDAILMMDPEGRISYWNIAAERIFGYTCEEAIGQMLHDFIVPRRFHEAHLIAFPDFLLTGQGDVIGKTLDLMAMRKDGKEISVQLSLSSFQLQDGWHAVGILRDITERRLMENQLKESENLQRSLIENVAVGIVIIDWETRVIESVNTFASLLIGEIKEEIVGKKCHQFLCPAEEHCCPVCDKGLNVDNSDRILLRADKTALPVLKTVKRIRIGGKEKLLESFVDITVQKEAEEALQNERTLFRTIIDLIPDGVYVKDTEGRKILANPKEVQLAGKNSEDEIIGKTDFQLYPGREAKRSQDEDQFVLNSGISIIDADGRLIDREGKLHWLLVSKVPLRDIHGKTTGIVGVTHDITERKMAENELKQISTRLALATRAGGVGVWDFDIVNNILLWDDQMFALYGVDKSNFEGAYETWLSGVHPDDVAQSDAEIQMAMRGEKEFDTEFRVVWPNGSVHNVRALAIVVRDDSDKPIRMIGTNWEITEQKKTEATLLMAKQEADIASKAKSEFLANMSHEIRTPLNGVIGFTDLLLKTPLNKIQKQYAENANTSGHSLLGIINDILDFSKIEAGKMELDYNKTDIIELAEQTSDIIKYHASRKGLELLLNIQHDLPRFAVTDGIRLKQIFVNLLGNAVKFTEAGEVELKITFTKKDETSGEFSFMVRDTGIGINEEQQKQLFKAFTQADSSITRKFGGTGLGLTISNMLAEKMGSKIEIISETGKGSNFFFTLETEYEVGEKLDYGSLTDIKRVLVIDDNDKNRMILEHTFINWGIEFTGIDSGLSALNIIEKSKPFDIIFVDYQMPFHNGIDTIKMIREQLKLTPAMQPIILLHSSSDDVDIHEECKKWGVLFNLTKPVKTQELLNYLKCIHNQPAEVPKGIKAAPLSLAIGIANDSSPVILIAEDVALNRLLAKTLIKQMIPNVRVVEAKNGRDAFDMAISINPDLIFMDVQMPDISGIEATVEIRNYEHGKDRRIPIVALTAGAIKGEKEKCLEAGMDDFITKPIDRDALKRILKQYLTPSFPLPTA
ncbi:MAG: PAS domain S-box protein [Bacteroidia bacterium]|nr:PAS domain S-box protein [Bacteroidia bacterium]